MKGRESASVESMRRSKFISNARRFIGFAGAGAVATFAHYSILIILVQVGEWDSTPASALGAVCGAFVSYVLNYRYVFYSAAGHADAMRRFFLIAGSGLMLNTVFMWIGVKGVGLHYLLSQIVATVLVLFWSFAANHKWTFGRAHG
jgi:putative flippase GtrA